MPEELTNLEDAVLTASQELNRAIAPIEDEDPNLPEPEVVRTTDAGDSTSYNVSLNFGGAQQTAPGTLPISEEQKQRRMIIGGAILFGVLIIMIIAVSMYKARKK